MPRINRSAETFSLSGLREWIEAVRDAQFDTDWLAAIDYAAHDRDAVVIRYCARLKPLSSGKDV